MQSVSGAAPKSVMGKLRSGNFGAVIRASASASASAGHSPASAAHKRETATTRVRMPRARGFHWGRRNMPFIVDAPGWALNPVLEFLSRLLLRCGQQRSRGHPRNANSRYETHSDLDSLPRRAKCVAISNAIASLDNAAPAAACAGFAGRKNGRVSGSEVRPVHPLGALCHSRGRVEGQAGPHPAASGSWRMCRFR